MSAASADYKGSCDGGRAFRTRVDSKQMRLSDWSIKTTYGDIAERNRDMHLLYHISGEGGDFVA